MRNDLRLCAISHKNIISLWELVEEKLVDALKYADRKYSIFDIQYALLIGDMQLWIIADMDDKIQAVVVTQLVSYPAKKVMFFILICGVRFDEWNHFLPYFISFAKEHNCESIEGYGRAGWEKHLKPLGFKKVHTVYSLPI